jgi:hypothetical protein
MVCLEHLMIFKVDFSHVNAKFHVNISKNYGLLKNKDF